MSTTITGGWPPSPANDPGLRKVFPGNYVVYNDPYDQKYHAIADGSLGSPGTDIVNKDAATVIQTAKDTLPNGIGQIFLKKGFYGIYTQLNWGSNIELLAEQGTCLRAFATIPSILGLASGGTISRSYIRNIWFDCNGFATNAINFNQPEIDAVNRISNCIFSNSTGKALVLDGCESTLLDFNLVESGCVDGISWLIPNGMGMMDSHISNIPLTGTDLIVNAQIMSIDKSVLNSIDCQSTNLLAVSKSYLANRTSQIKSTDINGPTGIIVRDSYIGLGSSANFLNITKLSGAGAEFDGCYFVALDGTTTGIANVLGVLAQTTIIFRNCHRSASTIKLEASTNVANIFVKEQFGSKGLNGVFTNSVDETNKIISFYTGTQSTAATASTVYTIKHANCLLTVTGGTGVSMTFKDANGTTILSGQTTPLTRYPVFSGYTVNFGGFSGAPTVLAEWI